MGILPARQFFRSFAIQPNPFSDRSFLGGPGNRKSKIAASFFTVRLPVLEIPGAGSIEERESNSHWQVHDEILEALENLEAKQTSVE